MSVREPLLSVGFDKNGGFDFAVTASVGDLTYAQMEKLRSMIVAGIGTMEQMWRSEQAAQYGAAKSLPESEQVVARGKQSDG